MREFKGHRPGAVPEAIEAPFRELARSLSSPLSFRSRLTAPPGSATKMPPADPSLSWHPRSRRHRYRAGYREVLLSPRVPASAAGRGEV
jgi:hypothetical protein